MKTIEDAARLMLDESTDFWARHLPTIENLSTEPRVLLVLGQLLDETIIKSFPLSPLHQSSKHTLQSALLKAMAIGLALGTEMEKP